MQQARTETAHQHTYLFTGGFAASIVQYNHPAQTMQEENVKIREHATKRIRVREENEKRRRDEDNRKIGGRMREGENKRTSEEENKIIR